MVSLKEKKKRLVCSNNYMQVIHVIFSGLNVNGRQI